MSTRTLRSRKLASDLRNSDADPHPSESTIDHMSSSRTTGMAASQESSSEDSRQPLLGGGAIIARNEDRYGLQLDHPSTVSSSRQRDVEVGELGVMSKDEMDSISKRSQWIVLAMASGACAAFNGVFAKLTTTELTTTFATTIADLIGLSSVEGGVELVVRAIFFFLNLLFNGIMWTLFTKALARGTSTTQVAIVNTSSNFMITAILGFLIFSESLPPLWFAGAGLLVAGNVIIGRRNEVEMIEWKGREVEGEELSPDGEEDEDVDEVQLGKKDLNGDAVNLLEEESNREGSKS